MLLRLLIVVILSTHAVLSYGQLEGWQFQLNFQSDTSRLTPAIFQLGPLSVYSTRGTTQGPHT